MGIVRFTRLVVTAAFVSSTLAVPPPGQAQIFGSAPMPSHLLHGCSPTGLARWNASEEKLRTEAHPDPRRDFRNALVLSRAGRDKREEALRLFNAAADENYAPALTQLGLMYESGTGVDANLAQAYHFYHRAALLGDARGQQHLGLMFYYGNSVRQDYAEAFSWFMKAAVQGDHRAEYDVGDAYEKGEGAPRNTAQALIWYSRAAAGGYACGAYALGRIYEQGAGIPRDVHRAMQWYAVAAGLGSSDGQDALDRLAPRPGFFHSIAEFARGRLRQFF